MITQITDSSKFYNNLNTRDPGETFYIFYHTPWDDQSVKMYDYIRQNFAETKHNFFIADIWELPDSYTVMKPKRIPSLFIVSETIKEQSIVSMIWRTFESMNKKVNIA